MVGCVVCLKLVGQWARPSVDLTAGFWVLRKCSGSIKPYEKKISYKPEGVCK